MLSRNSTEAGATPSRQLNEARGEQVGLLQEDLIGEGHALGHAHRLDLLHGRRHVGDGDPGHWRQDWGAALKFQGSMAS
jgi:hypothetical protein